MLSSRQGTLAVALTCALVAGGILVFAINRYRQSVNASGQQTTVFVAKGLIQKGTSGDAIAAQQLSTPTQILQKQVTAGAIADATALRGKVAAQDILPGQQLTAVEFTAGGGLVARLAPEERAISIPLDASHGLASVVHVGDRVDVYAGLNTNVNSNGGSSGGNGTASAAVRLLLANVPVLAVSLNTGSGGIGGGNVDQKADVVVKVGASAAGAIAFAADYGTIWLVLRGANATTPKNQIGVVFNYNSVIHGAIGNTP
jgi:Flp pilus assembly protein CpaB